MDFNPCIVIPVYNHPDTMQAMAPVLQELDFPCILVNDGSDEETTAALDQIAETCSHFSHHRLPENCGKGGAVLAGFTLARERGFTHAVQVDADNQHHLPDIPRFIETARAFPEALVLGRPIFDESIPKTRLRARYLTHLCVWIECLSTAIVDSMCGFRVYPLKPCALIGRLGRRMDFDTEIAVKLYWLGVEIINLDTPVTYHAGGLSHFRMVKDNVLISWMHIRLIFGMLIRSPKLLWRRISRSEKHWSEEEERGSLFLLNLALFLYKIFGRWMGKIIVRIVVTYFFATSRKTRRASQKYLKRLYAFNPEAPGFEHPPRWTDSYRHCMEFGNEILNRFAAWMGQIVRADILWENRTILTERIAAGQKGGVLIGAHMGNIEVIRAVIQGIPELKFNALAYLDHAPRVNEMLRKANPQNAVNIISIVDFTPDVAIMLKDKVEQGEYVVILSDRVPAGARERQCTIDFLGHPAAFPEGPMILASLLDCPIFLIFCLRKKASTYEVFLDPFAEERLHFPRKDRERHIREAVQRYAKRLEELCGIAPFQWFNFFDFWKD